VNEFTFLLISSISIANIRVVLGRRPWNAIAEAACTGVHVNALFAAGSLSSIAKFRVILLRRLWCL
jgi:hypothetical protein